MRARFPGLCSCGCRKPFQAGEELVRDVAGWVRAACADISQRPPVSSTTWFASHDEVRQVLAQARAVARREAAAAAARSASNLPPGLAGEPRRAASGCPAGSFF